jgi:hypothetical protein
VIVGKWQSGETVKATFTLFEYDGRNLSHETIVHATIREHNNNSAASLFEFSSPEQLEEIAVALIQAAKNWREENA